MKKLRNHSRGFTLVEILVVVGIILTLTTIILFSISEARKNSKIKNERLSVAQMELSMKLYLELKGHYPEGATTPTLSVQTRGMIFPDACSICELDPAMSPPTYEVQEWNASVNAMVSAGVMPVPKYTDEWGNPYGYDNNLMVVGSNYWTMVCSMGPDGVLQTFLASDRTPWLLTNENPVAYGDDICIFFE
jgi:prepilin-type N-terminal cleavage/methylation domain-containing protein